MSLRESDNLPLDGKSGGEKRRKRPSVFCYPFLSAEDNVGVAVTALVWAAEGR